MKKLPVGIDNFEKLRRENFYYVDKTGFIRDLLDNWGEVNLFTRPRRFGKTLNMSMLKSFFEIGANPALFEGLAISEETAMCAEYMGQSPVVFISLKGVDGLTFEQARDMLWEIISKEVRRLQFLESSPMLSDMDRLSMSGLTAAKADSTAIKSSLSLLTEMLYKHYGKKAILLIDEYDVPLDKAHHHGYYGEMVDLIRGMLNAALKTNDFLQFAVLTGCMRIAKESIFTGLNNLKVLSIVDPRFDEHFGFIDKEVKQLLLDYGLERHFDEVKDWYDGYRFGDVDVYCPWDVINYVDLLRAKPDSRPQAYWINTSSNDLVREFIDKADATTQDEIERLIAGEAIAKHLRMELTYEEVGDTIGNLWSVLFTTGYLTYTKQTEDGSFRLRIPNREVREVFVLKIQEWFRQGMEINGQPALSLCRALLAGDAQTAEDELTMIMSGMISVLDARARDEQKENFYHGLLLGLLRAMPDWKIMSNAEAGEGFGDILIEPRRKPNMGMVIEIKYAPTFRGLDEACARAMAQIRERRYDERLRNDGREDILAYGMAFCKKRCRVVCERL